MEKRRPGRPSVYGVATTTSLRVRVTAAHYTAVRRIAAVRGTDIAGVLREALDDVIEEEQELGTLEGAPPVFQLRRHDDDDAA